MQEDLSPSFPIECRDIFFKTIQGPLVTLIPPLTVPAPRPTAYSRPNRRLRRPERLCPGTDTTPRCGPDPPVGVRDHGLRDRRRGRRGPLPPRGRRRPRDLPPPTWPTSSTRPSGGRGPVSARNPATSARRSQGSSSRPASPVPASSARDSIDDALARVTLRDLLGPMLSRDRLWFTAGGVHWSAASPAALATPGERPRARTLLALAVSGYPPPVVMATLERLGVDRSFIRTLLEPDTPSEDDELRRTGRVPGLVRVTAPGAGTPGPFDPDSATGGYIRLHDGNGLHEGSEGLRGPGGGRRPRPARGRMRDRAGRQHHDADRARHPGRPWSATWRLTSFLGANGETVQAVAGSVPLVTFDRDGQGRGLGRLQPVLGRLHRQRQPAHDRPGRLDPDVLLGPGRRHGPGAAGLRTPPAHGRVRGRGEHPDPPRPGRHPDHDLRPGRRAARRAPRGDRRGASPGSRTTRRPGPRSRARTRPWSSAPTAGSRARPGATTVSGPYTTNGNAISIGPLAVTERACADPALTAQERDLLDALERGRHLRDPGRPARHDGRLGQPDGRVRPGRLTLLFIRRPRPWRTGCSRRRSRS